MKRAARIGDGWHPYMYTADRCRISFDEVVGFAEGYDRKLPDDYAWAVFIYVSLYDDIDEAREWGVKELSYRYDQDFAELVDKYCAYGPPERVIEYLKNYIDVGVNYFILAPIMPRDDRRAHLDKLATEVIPELEKIEPPKVQ